MQLNMKEYLNDLLKTQCAFLCPKLRHMRGNLAIVWDDALSKEAV